MVLAAAVVAGVLALVLFRKSKGDAGKAQARAAPVGGLADRLTGLVSDRPVVAAGAALAAGLLAWRNPTLVSTVLRMLESRPERTRS